MPAHTDLLTPTFPPLHSAPGGCNNRCAAGETCCSGQCVDLLTSPAHCSTCGRDCGHSAMCDQGLFRL